jgi:pyruvate dehydrogenase E2 component (dihydrolipoamide acetyltransferase)
MAIEIKLPELGEGVTEGELVKWLVKVGDSVKVDQPIAEFMTDKATVEVPTPTAGVVKALKAKEGDVVKVEQTLIELEAGAGATAAAPAPTKTHEAKPAPAPVVAAVAPAPMAAASMATTETYFPPVADSKVLATPATRRLAREMSVDINAVKGTGLAGRVTREDVVQQQGGVTVVAPSKAPGMSIPRPSYQGPAGAVEERVALRGIRKKIAENMQMAKAIIPHFT